MLIHFEEDPERRLTGRIPGPESRVVVRAGKSLLDYPIELDRLGRYLRGLKLRGRRPALVHEGEPALDELAEQARVPAITVLNDADSDPDRWAEEVAAKLDAPVLEFATDVRNVLTRRGPARVLTPPDARRLIGSGVVTGGMIPKLRAALAGLRNGLALVRIGTPLSLSTADATEVTPATEAPADTVEPSLDPRRARPELAPAAA